jgi:EAL domain-containing protein (putative c-di-GMP-specific phosphodiesterase class I)
LGPLEPRQFIPIAEQTGTIRGLTLWILEEVCRQSAEWRTAGVFLDVSVNISMDVMLDHQLPDLVSALLRQHGMMPEQLTLHVSESHLVRDPEPAEAVINRLVKLGVRIGLDDVGAHRSSFDLVSRLPLSEMKFRQSVARQLFDTHGPNLVSCILGLGNALELDVVADGVDDHRTWERLSKLGCHLMQGAYVSSPQSADQVAAWVHSEKHVPAALTRV